MKIINLTDLDKSEIKYKISKFPDGQQNIVIDPDLKEKLKEEFWATPGNRDAFRSNIKQKYEIKNSINSIQIKSRLNNWLDLELIVATVASLRELGVQEIHLYTPYFIGARSDRKFEEGGNWYLKQVICPIINNLDFASVTVLDAHSSVLGNLLNNYKAIDNKQLVEFVFRNLHTIENNSTFSINNFILISPDAGASHKIYKLAEKIGYKGDIITCSKERDTEGNLTKTVVPLNSMHSMSDMIIIDDICDGGRTFINIAKTINNYKEKLIASGGHSKGKLYLIVTHAIFSAGYRELTQYFDQIYCTNSYSDIGDYIGNNMEKTNVKQLNVF